MNGATGDYSKSLEVEWAIEDHIERGTYEGEQQVIRFARFDTQEELDALIRPGCYVRFSRCTFTASLTCPPLTWLLDRCQIHADDDGSCIKFDPSGGIHATDVGMIGCEVIHDGMTYDDPNPPDDEDAEPDGFPWEIDAEWPPRSEE